MRYLSDTQIELVNPDIIKRGIRFAVFDFDGTVSLIREGWQGIMIPMMVDILAETPTRETRDELNTVVVDFVDRLTGRQTIYQMIRLAEEVVKRGGLPEEPLVYKHRYHDMLWERIEGRITSLKNGTLSPESLMVPGVERMLKALRSRDVILFLASGTDLTYVQEEVAALGVVSLFNGGVYGALDQYKQFSKQKLLNDIITAHNLTGSELVVIGDGFVEIEEALRVGSVAVGVASDEARRCGIDEWKRKRLLEAGADIIIPDFREWETLTAYLFGEYG